VPDLINHVYQQVVDVIGIAVEAKLLPGRDGTISRFGHLPDPQHVFLSPGPDNGAESRQLIEFPVHSLSSVAEVGSI
jgi:hypothetical protein